MEMTHCAGVMADAADDGLNLAYRLARETARRRDEGLEADAVPSVILLRDAQRAWMGFRDRACETEATLARGGTMASQLYLNCLERLTRRRTEDLRLFGEAN